MKAENVSVVGVGYVGLTLAAVLAERGFKVTGVDINKPLLERLSRCEPHFYEKGLPLLLRKTVGKNLFFSDHIPRDSDTIILSVGTYVNPKTKIPILEQVINSAEQASETLKDNSLVIVRSTVPIGTTRNVVKPILDKSKKEYYLAFCPERTIEGKALDELRELPQIIGGINEESIDRAFDIFKRITNTIVKMSSLEATEMVKLLCNSYRDLNFAYANEVALICGEIRLDPHEVIKAANSGYERSKISTPGFVGGSCLVKDPHILNYCVAQTGYKPRLITGGREVNEGMVDYVLKRIREKVGLEGKMFITGMAFKGKPETDDLRGSPSVDLVERLKNTGYGNISVHDFVVPEDKLKDWGYKPVSLENGFENSDCVVIGNNHERYAYLNIDFYLGLMKEYSLFFDVWRMFEPEIITNNHINYASIGK